MPVVDAARLLDHAAHGAYAVCAFDVPDVAALSAILAAAEREQAPVVLGVSRNAPLSPEHLLPAIEAGACSASVPVVIAYRGASSLAESLRAINLGCNALFGAPAVSAAARDQCGIAILSDAIEADTNATKADYASWLAVGVTLIAHEGLCDAAVPPARGDYAHFVRAFQHALEQQVTQRLQWSGSSAQAASARASVPAVEPVEHCIVYNVDGAHAHRVAEVMERGRRILANIPGVRAVFTGRAETPAAKYQYCWLVRFAHPAVIDSYRDHPDHVAFANAHFRPIAADRLTIDFRRVE